MEAVRNGGGLARHEQAQLIATSLSLTLDPACVCGGGQKQRIAPPPPPPPDPGRVGSAPAASVGCGGCAARSPARRCSASCPASSSRSIKLNELVPTDALGSALNSLDAQRGLGCTK
ncbi:hypothetical protein U9M48_035352, partial [Paspalum notatum var. saurae]